MNVSRSSKGTLALNCVSLLPEHTTKKKVGIMRKGWDNISELDYGG